MPDWTDILQGIGSMIGAVTSVILVVIAFMFRDEVRAARRRPELSLTHDPTNGDAQLFNDPDANYWLMARISNAPGRDAALRVQLELVSVSIIGNEDPCPNPIPLRPLRVAEVDSVASDIPADFSRTYIIAFIDERTSSGAELEVRPRSTTGRDILPPGLYRLFLALTADNADTTYWRMDLSLSKRPEVGDNLPAILSISELRHTNRLEALPR
jgi:hypothetical protein